MKYLYKLIILTSLVLPFSSCNKVNSPNQELTKTNSFNQLNLLKSKVKYLNKVTDSLKTELQRQEIKFRSLEEASTGEFIENKTDKENKFYGFNYRIEIYISEIYKFLYLTKVDFFGEGSSRISSTYKIDLEKELNISSEETNDLHFVKWTSPSEFEIQVNNKTYTIKVISFQKVEIKNKNL
ncbi:MAG: hypothetical protein M3Q05_06955 [Bacteroidota bacterium]|nr:hypothetical protein [Bacteroidota bacterium]